MDLSKPYSALSPSLDAEVLVVLARTSRPLTGREVARLARRGSQRGVLLVLARLAEHGLVDRQEAGPALLFSLNREHLAAPAVGVIAGMRSALVGRLRERIDSWAIPPVHASMFGSAARGDGDTASDVDLFIVRPDGIAEDNPIWREQLEHLAVAVLRWTGNQAAAAEVAEEDLRRLREEQPPVVAELRSDAVVLAGREVRELLEHPRDA
jgi:predicted nucleotidyltransferase